MTVNDSKDAQDRPVKNGFENLDTIVAEPLKFKVKLAIGEDAYTSLRVKNTVVQVWDVAGVATTAAVVAKSSVVASTFFAPTGWLAAIGIGTAVTPIGWVVAAGVVTGGAWFGITRHLKRATASRVTVVPNFINTPLDVLALGLFDLMMPMALKMAAAEDRVDAARYRQITNYFVNDWGFDAAFVDAGIRHLESRLDDVSIRELAQTMAEFASQNRDCNFGQMSREIVCFLRDIVTVNGAISPADEAAIVEVEALFKSARRFSPVKRLRSGVGLLRQKSVRLLARLKPRGRQRK
jgi:hypothetical protein